MGDREKDIELSVDDLTDVVGGVDIAAVRAGDLAANSPAVTRGAAERRIFMLISFRVTCTSRRRLNLITYVNQSDRGIILRPFFVCWLENSRKHSIKIRFQSENPGISRN